MKTIVIKCPKCDQKTFEVSVDSDEALALLSDEDGMPKSVEFRKGTCNNEECKYSKDEDSSDLMAVLDGLEKGNIDDTESKLQLLQVYVGDTFATEFCKGYLNYLKRQYAMASEDFQEASKLYSKNLDDKVSGQTNYFWFWFNFMRLLSLCHLKDKNNFISTWNEVKYRLETNNAKNKKKDEETKVLTLFDFSLNTLKLISEFKEMDVKDIQSHFGQLKKYLLKTKTALNPALPDDYVNLIKFDKPVKRGLMLIVLFFITAALIQKQFVFLLEVVINKLDGTQITKEFEWFEQFLSKIIPVHDNPLRNDFWYWPIKFRLNELQFKHYVLQGDVESAFKYIEDKGVDFIKQDKGGFFLIPAEDVPEPFRYAYEDWGEMRGGLDQFEDMIDDNWHTPLKSFYMPAQMYQEYLKNPRIEKTAGKEIKERILKLARNPGHDDSYIRITYPSFVAKIAEELGKFDDAIYFYENSNLDRNIKLTAIENCRLLRDGIRYEELRKVLRALEENKQRQLVAYSWIFSIETRLRSIIWKIIDTNIDNFPKQVRDECTKNLQDWCEYQTNKVDLTKIRLIDFATLPQLRVIILDNKNWKNLFSTHFGNIRKLRTTLNTIEDIRNDIAHARLLTNERYGELEIQIQKMSVKLTDIETILNQGI